MLPLAYSLWSVAFDSPLVESQREVAFFLNLELQHVTNTVGQRVVHGMGADGDVETV